MSQYIVSARKYRPTRFEDVVGQEHISTTLKKALRSGHLAHAFLFCGPRGVGKTTCARILAKVINCRQVSDDFEPCNTCDSCSSFNENASFNIVELDGASNNSVEDMRMLVEKVRFPPQHGKYKVFIIDEVHMLSKEAFNAFLKTLEEPPPHIIFILATTEKHKIIPTILSRCQIYDFRRITVQDVVKHLQHICRVEGISSDESALQIIGQKADGALRDALSIFDRMVAAGGNEVRYQTVVENLHVLDYEYFFRAVDMLLSEDMASLLVLFDDISRKGFDPDEFILGLAEHIRNLLVCKNEVSLSLLETADSLRPRYGEQARLAPAALLLSVLNLANDCNLRYKDARNKRLHIEMTLIKMAYVQRALRKSPLTIEADPEKKNPDLNVFPPETTATDRILPLQPQTTFVHQHAPTPSNVAPVVQEPKAEFTSQPPLPAAQKVQPKLEKFGMVKLSQIDAIIDEDAALTKDSANANAPELNQESLFEAWHRFVDSLETEMAKPFLRAVEIELLETEIIAKVGTPLAEGTLIQERSDLIEYLRRYFSKPDLILSVKLEKRSADPTDLARSAPLNYRDKLRLMQQANPNLKTLWERFGLSIEDDN
jgi:DNA polymerase-3 subunit gamma/tau